MKKLSKMVLLLGSVFLLTLFASCSNGSSSDDSKGPGKLAGHTYVQAISNTTLTFKEDGETFTITYPDIYHNTYTSEGKYVVNEIDGVISFNYDNYTMKLYLPTEDLTYDSDDINTYRHLLDPEYIEYNDDDGSVEFMNVPRSLYELQN